MLFRNKLQFFHLDPKKILAILTVAFILFFSKSYATSLEDELDLEPSHYVVQFTLLPDRASQLLSQFWIHGNKEKLAEEIKVTPPTLKKLMEDKVANKALRGLNEALIENSNIWNRFSDDTKAHIILGQLISSKSTEEVAQKLGITCEQLTAFTDGAKNSTILKCLSKVSIKNWPDPKGEVHEGGSPALTSLQATYDNKAKSGADIHFVNYRYIASMGGAPFQVYFSSSDRPPGYSQPDVSPLLSLQKKHLKHFEEVVGEFKSSDPNVSPQKITDLVGKMSIHESPIPGTGQVYVQSPEKKKALVQHPVLNQSVQRKLFTDGDSPPNHLSTTPTLHESLAHCRPKESTFEGDRRYPIKPYSYKHSLLTGHEITFDRGHGCDHADTLQHGGVLSTYDADNYVPQNSFYNRQIRNPLVKMIRATGGAYKEIALYHPNPYMINETKIPEGFIFIELYMGIADKAYFFPNFISYESLNFEKPFKSNYINFLSLFRADALIDYFFIPFVQFREPLRHMEQTNKAYLHFHRIPIDIRMLFKNLTENALPPRALSTLTRNIMNQNINTAAILDFQTLTSIETAINYYASSDTHWYLDERSVAERNTAFETYLPKLSEPIQNAYRLTAEKYAEEAKDDRVFRGILTQSFGTLSTALQNPDLSIINLMIGGQKVQDIPLAKKFLDIALLKIKEGVFNNRDLQGIQRILMHIPELENYSKVQELDKLYSADENISKDDFMLSMSPIALQDRRNEEEIRMYFYREVIQNKVNLGREKINSKTITVEELFDLLSILKFEPDAEILLSIDTVYDYLFEMELTASTLLQKKNIADFLWLNDYQENTKEWVAKIEKHIELSIQNRNKNDLCLCIKWLHYGSGPIEKNIEFANYLKAFVHKITYGVPY